MASFKDLKTEWSMLCQECTDCWTRTDLQLAAELGKTLLERNKELENNLKQQQNTIDEQAQEIEYMKKQTAALREVNDSRLRVYEQLEVSIQDLERANHRLALENSSDKKQIKSQGVSIESLEARCEELQKKLDELTDEHETLLRRLHHVSGTADATPPRITATWKAKVSQDGSIEQVAASPIPLPDKAIDTSIRELATTLANDDEVTELLRQLHETKNQRSREQKKVVELGEQLNFVLQENLNLGEQLNVWRQKAEGMKNLQDEISTLEEVRQGHLCGRCLRGVDNRTHDALSIMLDQEEDDDLSLIDSITTDSHRDSGTPLPQENCVKVEDEEVEDNPYRVLVEKYEALLEVQRHPVPHRKASGPTGTCLSLQEELVMSGDFNSFTNTSLQSELKSNQPVPYDNKVTGGCKLRSVCKKPFSGTPTDLSEAESSSSGFSDETSNKATQTDDRTGSLLCSIADGEDCKFSIYDDASPIESRFSKTPEYRHLFREIFEVLKRAAEAKDEGEKFPLLDESHQTSATASGVSHSKTLREKFTDAQSEIADDTQSVVSSIVSSVVSEPPYRSQTPVCSQKQTTSQSTKNADPLQAKPANTNMSSPNNPANNEGRTNNTAPVRPMLTPVKRQPLEYLSIGVGIRKKSSAKKNSARKVSPVGANADIRPSTPETVQSTNPKIVQTKANSGGRRKFRAATFAEQSSDSNPAVWNGNTLNFFPSKQTGAREPTNNGVPKQSNSFVRYVSEHHNTTYEYRPSTASAEVARLKRLEMSYAEALRMPNKPKTTNNNRRH